MGKNVGTSRKGTSQLKKVGISFDHETLAHLDDFAKMKFEGNRSAAINYDFEGFWKGLNQPNFFAVY